MHPSITAAVAEQHRRDLIARAEMYRLAHAARSSRTAATRHASRQMKIIQLPVTAARRAATRVFSRYASSAVTTGPGRSAHATLDSSTPGLHDGRPAVSGVLERS
jgi:hypothetical protein